jgi:hypothetical protein
MQFAIAVDHPPSKVSERLDAQVSPVDGPEATGAMRQAHRSRERAAGCQPSCLDGAGFALKIAPPVVRRDAEVQAMMLFFA